ncbi:MAG TPA: hypothetical protein VGI98_01335 [Candidatus Limnocylindrales bacterium]
MTTTSSTTETTTSATRDSDAATTGPTIAGMTVPTAEIRDTIDRVAQSVPDVARNSRTMMEDAMQNIERSSDERVAAGVTLSLGLAIGMLLGGAPRILTVLALVPVAAFGLVLMDRRTGATGRGTSRSSAS